VPGDAGAADRARRRRAQEDAERGRGHEVRDQGLQDLGQLGHAQGAAAKGRRRRNRRDPAGAGKRRVEDDALAVRALALVAALSAVAWADVPVGGACKKDAECAVGSICDQGVCTPLPKRKWIPPFYFEQGGDVGYRYLTLPPLYFSDWDRERKLHVAPELLLWAKSFADGGHEFGWLPFVVWRNEGGERTLAVPLALAGMHATREREFTTALLLWWRWKNLQRGSDHALFLPFFEWESERRGRKQRFVSLVAAWDKDDDAGM